MPVNKLKLISFSHLLAVLNSTLHRKRACFLGKEQKLKEKGSILTSSGISSLVTELAQNLKNVTNKENTTSPVHQC